MPAGASLPGTGLPSLSVGDSIHVVTGNKYHEETDLPASEARNLLREVLESIDPEKRASPEKTILEELAASLACRAAIKVNMKLTPEKMRWLIDRLVLTSSPTTCPHGRPIILRLTTRDIERGFHRP